MRKTALSAEVMRRLGRPLTPEEADVLIVAELIIEERDGKEGRQATPLTIQ